MSEDEESGEDGREVVEAIAGRLGVDASEIDRDRQLGTESEDEESEEDGPIEIHANCPECTEPMSINTVVSQEDRDRNGRTRYEAICADCQMGMVLTVMRTVNDFEELFGFDAPERDWDVEALGEPYADPEEDET